MNNKEIKVSVKDIPEVIEQLQQAEEKINNLQSKIGKANKYLEEHTDKLGKIRVPKIDFNYNELSDILEED